MKRSGSAVKFAEPEEPPTTSSSKEWKTKGMRYGRILGTLTGSQAAETDEGTRKVFNRAAAPSKPAMKVSRSGNNLASLYPDVDKDGNPLAAAQQAAAPNPATGLVGYQTRGGAALASALGVNDGLAIPPVCPPALPNTVALDAPLPSAPGHAPVGSGPISNPLAVQDMPLMAPLAPTNRSPGAAAAVAPAATAAAAAAAAGAAAGGRDLQAAMPPAVLADGTVQLSTAGSGSGTYKLQADDVEGSGGQGLQQRDQGRKVAAEWQKPAAAAAAAGGWQSGGQASTKDIEADDALDVDSPTGAMGKAADYDDDNSR